MSQNKNSLCIKIQSGFIVMEILDGSKMKKFTNKFHTEKSINGANIYSQYKNNTSPGHPRGHEWNFDMPPLAHNPSMWYMDGPLSVRITK